MANRVWAHFRPASEPLTPRITRQCSKKKRDRKSTRLNSSHLVISYAVFCLKKKTRLNSSHLVISYAVFCLKKKKTTNNTIQNVSNHGGVAVKPSAEETPIKRMLHSDADVH